MRQESLRTVSGQGGRYYALHLLQAGTKNVGYFKSFHPVSGATDSTVLLDLVPFEIW